MTPEPQPPLDDLLSRQGWLTALARRLVDDPALADDLVQETQLEALRRPPPAGPGPGWLATVMRHALGQLRRSEARRRARDRAVSVPEAVAGPQDLLARVEAQTVVARAVLELAEPYRETILLRYWEELPTRLVARRQGVTVDTVHSRLRRGLAQLRGRLDGRYGSRAAWAGLLLVPRPAALAPAPTALLLGGLLVKAPLWIVLCALSLAVGGTLLWLDDTGPVPAAEPLAPRTVEAPSTLPAPDPAGAAAPQRLVAPSTPLDPPGPARSAPPASVEPVPVSGRVLDAAGRALADHPVVAVTATGEAVGEPVLSDGLGSFVLADAHGARELRSARAGWSTLAAGLVAPGRDTLVVAAPGLDLAGEVRDEQGRALDGAELRVVLPATYATRLPSLDTTRPLHRTWRATSDADGRFRLPRGAVVEGAVLRAVAAGMQATSVELPDEDRDDLLLVLRRAAPDGGLVVRGIVVDPGGQPVPDARVVLGRHGARSDADGRFVIEREPGADELLALARGWLPGRLPLPATEDGHGSTAGTPGDVVDVELRLGDAPLSLAGTLRDEQGHPLAGARLWVDGGEPLAGLDGRLATVEGWLAGGDTLADLRRRLGPAAAGIGTDTLRFEHPTESWGWVTSDADGRFRIGGLQARDYRIDVLLPRELRRESLGPFAAGEQGLSLVLPRPRRTTVAGRVVGRDGSGVPGVEVQLHAWVLRVGDWPPAPGRPGTQDALDGPVTHTDEQGRFRFRPVALAEDDLFLVVSGDAVMSDVLGIDDGLGDFGPIDALTLPMVRRVHLRVELPAPHETDGFSVLDVHGEGLELVSFEDEGRRSTGRAAVLEGRSAVYAVPETAATLVLWDGEWERARRPLSLIVGEVNVVGP